MYTCTQGIADTISNAVICVHVDSSKAGFRSRLENMFVDVASSHWHLLTGTSCFHSAKLTLFFVCRGSQH